MRIGRIVRDYKFNEENPEKIRLKETLDVCYVPKGLEKTSQSDSETTQKACAILDALYETLKHSDQKSPHS